jgi:GT2 family glycosyltransferase
MRVAAVVINYRTPELTAQVVTALLADLQTVGSHALFLVDNQSGDGSLDHFAAQGWDERVHLIAAPRNGGYGYGINLAVQHACAGVEPPEFIYVLNSDAFTDAGTLPHLLAALEADPQAGVAGSRIHGPDGQTQVTAFRFPSFLGELEQTARFGVLSRALSPFTIPMDEPAQTAEVDWVSGTSLLIRRRVFEDTGGFDERYFLYFEETDFCRQAQARGWKVIYVAGAPITHLGSVSTGMADGARRMPRYWFESRHRYLLKHHGLAYTAACDGAWVLGNLIWRAKQRLLGRTARDRPHLLMDFLAASARDLWRAA